MRTIIIVAIVACMFHQNFAQSIGRAGEIKGKLVDGKTKEPIPGVNVILDKAIKPTGATTEANGNFTLSNLPDGTYTIILSYIGYTTKYLSGLVIEKGSTLELGTIDLEESAMMLGDVTVTPGSFSVMGTAPLTQQTLTAKDLKNMSWAEDLPVPYRGSPVFHPRTSRQNSLCAEERLTKC